MKREKLCAHTNINDAKRSSVLCTSQVRILSITRANVKGGNWCHYECITLVLNFWCLLQLIFQVTKNIQKMQNHCHQEIDQVNPTSQRSWSSHEKLIVTIWAVIIRIIDSSSITPTICTTWRVNHRRPIILAGMAMT